MRLRKKKTFECENGQRIGVIVKVAFGIEKMKLLK